jgi:glutathione synthase/RimK-type ligase-like ATP-grasp enzyme
MKKVGILVGREKTFPDALIRSINERGKGDVVAEYITVGGVRYDEGREYDIIIDRISHEVPFYRAMLKRAALEGTLVINNPFWWSADDKFFNFALARKLGVAIPKTVLLPQKDYIPGIVTESLRNLEFPLDWQGIVDYTGLPAILKPFDGGGWKNVSRVNTLEELWFEYDQTGTLCMTLQEFIHFDQFVRCYCIGQEEVMIMPYDPTKSYLSGEQYINNPNYLTTELAERITNDVRTICRALGYDINTVEFAIKDNVPYAIDFMNPAPDAELISVGEFYHNWVTNAVTEMVFKRLEQPREQPRYRWDAMLNPEPSNQPLRAAAATAGAIVTGVGEMITDAASAVSEIVESVVSPKPKTTKGAKKENGATKTKKATTPRAKK